MYPDASNRRLLAVEEVNAESVAVRGVHCLFLMLLFHCFNTQKNNFSYKHTLKSTCKVLPISVNSLMMPLILDLFRYYIKEWSIVLEPHSLSRDGYSFS